MLRKNEKISQILAPISIGELIDKLTILEIKKEKMKDKKLTNVEIELKYIKEIIEKKDLEVNIILLKNLKKVNMILWEIEDQIRIKESKKEFDKDFIELAISVYKQNDLRSSIKKEINLKYNSEIIEEKSYSNS